MISSRLELQIFQTINKFDMKKDTSITDKTKAINYEPVLCTVIKRCKDCKHYKQHRCLQMIDDVPEMAVIRFPNAVTKCTMFEKQ